MRSPRSTDYVLGRRLGSGAFGSVYAAVDQRSKQRVVLKQIPIHGVAQKEKADALNEVQLMARISHAHVVRYSASFVEDEVLHIVMEHCQGGDLRRYLEKRAGALLEEAHAWRLLLQTATGVAYLHAHRVLHRDLKSSNLFLTKGGDIKIGDLGVSKLLGDSTEHAATLVGTPYYLSPELCENAKYDAKSDMWAFGVVCYEVLTCGKYPFTANNQAALIMRILRGGFEPPPACYSAVLRELVDSLLQPEPGRRPSAEVVLLMEASTAHVAALHLEAALVAALRLEETNTVAAISPPDKPLPPPPPPPCGCDDATEGRGAPRAPPCSPPTGRPSMPGARGRQAATVRDTAPVRAANERAADARAIAARAGNAKLRQEAAQALPATAARYVANAAAGGNRVRRSAASTVAGGRGNAGVAAGVGLSAARLGIHDVQRREAERQAAAARVAAEADAQRIAARQALERSRQMRSQHEARVAAEPEARGGVAGCRPRSASKPSVAMLRAMDERAEREATGGVDGRDSDSSGDACASPVDVDGAQYVANTPFDIGLEDNEEQLDKQGFVAMVQHHQHAMAAQGAGTHAAPETTRHASVAMATSPWLPLGGNLEAHSGETDERDAEQPLMNDLVAEEADESVGNGGPYRQVNDEDTRISSSSASMERSSHISHCEFKQVVVAGWRILSEVHPLGASSGSAPPGDK